MLDGLNQIASPITAGIIVANVLVALALSLLISWIYKKTHHGLSYSKNLIVSLVILTVAITLTMMTIGSNIVGAFVLLGAFTIIRFRTAIKDTRDVSFIFWSLITGIAVGTHNYLIAVLGAALLGLIVFALHYTKFGSMRNTDHILSFKVATDQAGEKFYKDVMDKYLKFQNMLNMQSAEDGRKMEFTFNIGFKYGVSPEEFIKEFSSLKSIEDINIITARDDIEY